MFNKNLKLENETLKQRVAQLEFLMCKGKHDFTKDGNYKTVNGTGNGDEEFLYKKTCTVCGKVEYSR